MGIGRARIHTRFGRSHGDAPKPPTTRGTEPLMEAACDDSPHGGHKTVNANTVVVVVIACVVVIIGAAGMLIARDKVSINLALIIFP